MDDRQIIELYRQRDEQAIAESDKKYGTYCFCIANNILENASDSEECVNDTWLRTWNSIPPQKPNSLRLFLAKITRNLAFDRYRAAKSQKRGGCEIEVALDEINEFIPAADDSAEDAAYDELLRSVNGFLRSLPPRECNIFINRYFHVSSIADIAKKYGISVANAQKILSRTRQKLKVHLQSEGYNL